MGARNNPKAYQDRLLRTRNALERNEFAVFLASNKKEALQKALELIPPDAKVGVGGSTTIREIRLIEALTERGNQVVHHWLPDISQEDRLRLITEENTSDVYLCSSNAITEDGQLVNVDGAGNRVAAMIFGPKKVIVIAGKNKIVKNVSAALKRLKHIAGPLNAKRLNLAELPCVKTGECMNCNTPKRICRVVTFIEKAPSSIRKPNITVLLVGENLGF